MLVRQGEWTMRAAAAGPDDLDAAWAIIGDCRKTLEARGLLQWNAEYPSRAFFKQALAAGNLFVLSDAEGISGVAVLDGSQPPEWASAAWNHRDGQFLVIHAFAVAPRVQRCGHGKMLLACCEDVAKQRGCASIRIDAFSENSGALRFWERHGYRFRGEVRFASKPAGHQRYRCYEKSLERRGGLG
jgi:ribosomal protein S18 acetylase RimI-like enzyme